MKVFAYCRISTKEELKKQTMERQIFTIKEFAQRNGFKIDNDDIYMEEMSGKTLDRPVWNLLSGKVARENDVIILCDLDRMGRNADDVISTVKDLKRKKIRLCILDTPYLDDWSFVMNIDNKSQEIYNMTIDILITIKAHMAEQERLKLSNRTKQSLAAKKAQGKKLGRPESKRKDDFIKMYPRVHKKELSIKEAISLLGISRNQFYVLKRKYITEEMIKNIETEL